MAEKKPEVLDLETNWQVNYPGWVISIGKDQVKNKTEAIQLAEKAHEEWLKEQPAPDQE